MKQYVDKSALLARIKKLKMDIGNIFNEYDEGFWEGRTTAFDDVICALDTLEVKEVDLDKEIKEQIDKYYENCNKKLEEMGEDDNDISFLTLDGFARHFYELGLKAKGE